MLTTHKSFEAERSQMYILLSYSSRFIPLGRWISLCELELPGHLFKMTGSRMPPPEILVVCSGAPEEVF